MEASTGLWNGYMIRWDWHHGLLPRLNYRAEKGKTSRSECNGREYVGTKRVVLICVVREVDHFAWARKNLEEAIEAAAKDEVEKKTKFYVSGASRSGNERSLISARKMNEKGVELAKDDQWVSGIWTASERLPTLGRPPPA